MHALLIAIAIILMLVWIYWGLHIMDYVYIEERTIFEHILCIPLYAFIVLTPIALLIAIGFGIYHLVILSH